jgi:hypothetical protein
MDSKGYIPTKIWDLLTLKDSWIYGWYDTHSFYVANMEEFIKVLNEENVTQSKSEDNVDRVLRAWFFNRKTIKGGLVIYSSSNDLFDKDNRESSLAIPHRGRIRREKLRAGKTSRERRTKSRVALPSGRRVGAPVRGDDAFTNLIGAIDMVFTNE